MKDYFLIMNPGSHSGRSRKSFDRIISLMGKSGADFEFRVTKGMDHAVQLSRFANQEGYKNIIAVGGDGTINAVVNGFFSNLGRRLSDARLGVVYTGTSPDFNKSYNIPVSTDQAVDVILKGNETSIPVGMISFSDSYTSGLRFRFGSQSVRFFVCCANIGLGPQLARKANSGIRHRLGDFAGTFVSLVGLLARFKPFRVVIDAGNGKVATEKLINISVGITPYIASGIRVPIQFQAERRQFFVLTVQNMTSARIIPLLRKVYAGKPFRNNDYLTLSYTNQIKFYTIIRLI